jgi:hypothetical protein
MATNNNNKNNNNNSTMKGGKRRPLSDWNKFVMAVKKNNPNLKFSEVLKLAGSLKRKGVTLGNYMKNKTMNAVNKISKMASKTVGVAHKKRKTSKGKKSRRRTMKNKKSTRR